jgi:environmental stress-induced protein Ves
MRLLRAADRVAMPWKNGGGVTREVCAVPEDGGFEFDWRLSIAEVRSGGPFSSFPGVDRKLAVIEGSMRLAISDQKPVELEPTAPALAFAGEARASAEVVRPVVDVNLMTRRSRYRGALVRLQLDQGVLVGEPDAETIVLAIDPVAASDRELFPLDAIWLGPGSRTTIMPRVPAGRILIAHVWPVASPETD